jgi:hypothetical protein
VKSLSSPTVSHCSCMFRTLGRRAVCTQMGQNETLESRGPIMPSSSSMTLNGLQRQACAPRSAGRCTDASAGAKHTPPRPSIRSVVSANLKLPPQAFYSVEKRATAASQDGAETAGFILASRPSGSASFKLAALGHLLLRPHVSSQ